jgi:hypothetical protein
MNRVLLLDRSGSMNTCREDTIGGFNAFIETQKQHGGTMTLCLFDHEFQTVYEKMPIEDVPPLQFVPRGSTALYDAIGNVLKMDLTGDVMVVILTDGEENASTKYTAEHIKDLIELKPWTFVYLGANQDAVLNSSRIGIRKSLGFDTRETPEVFRTLSEAMSNYSTNGQLEI